MKKIVAVIAIHGREHITLKTVLRLKHQSYPIKDVVLIGETPKEQKLAEVTGSHFLKYQNNPLGAKWQAGMEYARKLHPDVILILGSDDWLSDGWCARMMQEIENGYDLVGKKQIYFLNVTMTSKKLIRWTGYNDPARKNEPIGAGRLISRNILDKMNWDWFPKNENGGLDKFSYWKMLSFNGRVKIVDDESQIAMDIKSPFWENIWSFESIPGTPIKDVDSWLDRYFPDASSFFNLFQNQNNNNVIPKQSPVLKGVSGLRINPVLNLLIN